MKLIETIKINNVINWSYGIFQYAFDNDLLPLVDLYLTDDITRNTLDFELYSKYKDRDLSRYAIFLFEEVGGGKIGTQQFSPLAVVETIVYKYRKKWDKLIEAFSETYNPIHNYDMQETSTELIRDTEELLGTVTDVGEETTDYSETLKKNVSVSTSNSLTGESSTILNETSTQSHYSEVASSGSNQVFGFNSNTPVDSTSNGQTTITEGTGEDNKRIDSGTTSVDVNNSSTTTTTANGETNYDDKASKDIVSKSGSTTTDNTKNYQSDVSNNLRRVGNIGVTTTQNMLQQEVDLRTKNILSDIIVRDVVREITLAIYVD